MSVVLLQAQQFRNFPELSLQPHPKFNLLVGENGSGKTSLLEAIYYLAHGRSFRTSRHQGLIRHTESAFILHAKVSSAEQNHSIGIQRERSADLQLRLNGSAQCRLADIAELLPVQLLTPDSFKLFFGGPKERRQFFDMGVFHVEHAFFNIWLQFSRVLKQRNALLKQSRQYSQQFEYWDQQFVELAWQLQALRQRYIIALQQAFSAISSSDVLLSAVTIQLYAGWPEKLQSTAELQDLLSQSFAQDLRLGFTQYGPQKADLKLRSQGHSVEEVLSRGQLKVLLFALKVAQNNLIGSSGLKQPILLIDDLASELDPASTRKIFDFLTNINSQVFITAINADQVTPFIAADCRQVFHVEQGQITSTDR
jgi:DNA replication and repair protein RecF